MIDGPDTHGNQPRNTLLDNYHSQTHESSSGQYRRLPHHLDGFTRWNNVSEESRLLDMWTTNPQYYFITQSNLIGYVGASGLSNTYSEFSGSNVYPNSLYEAQLERRLGYLPLWVDDSKHKYNEFFGLIFGGELPPPRKLAEDVNDDGTVNIQDLVLVAGRLGQSGANSADVNGDGVVNIQDLVLVAGALGSSATAPSLYAKDFSMLTAADVKKWLSEAQQLDLTDATSLRGILFLQQLLAALTNPKETALLPNYPNPFNPETWIPYNLAKASDVQITIYDVCGVVVRQLDLGHQREGYYINRNRAAHWNGANAVGERVATGIYFYTLTAGKFTATRKMLILK